MSNENLHKEHINFIAGVRNSKKNRLRSCRLGSTDLGEIAESAASSVINLKKARQKLRSNQRLFDSVAAANIANGGDEFMASCSTASKFGYQGEVKSSTTTGVAISIIDGSGTGSSGGELPKIKMSSHPFMSAHDEELLSSIATATSCSQKKNKSNHRIPLNIQHDEQHTHQQQSPLPPLPPSHSSHHRSSNQQSANPLPVMNHKNLADNSSLTNLTIETNDLSLANEVGGGVGTATGIRRGNGSGKQLPSLSTTTVLAEQNNSIHNNQVAAQSPGFIRDRYYQILREQVFPFLQKPSNNLNINQSPKEVQNYCNDVLY